MPLGSEFPRWPIEMVAALVARPEELPLSVRTIAFLKKTDFGYFGDVISRSASELSSLPQCDDKIIDELADFSTA
jgi:DNA-directed RNA polymerase alpha subunit